MIRSLRHPFLATVFSVAILGAGCATPPRPAADDAVPSATAADSTTPVAGSGTLAPSSSELVIRPADAAILHAAVREPGAQVTLVNVWATWCGPCRDEFPEIVRLERAWRDRGARVMFVSADFDDQLPEVRAFLSKQGVTAPSWIKTGDDMAFINAMAPRWSGALPATFIYDSRGELVRFWEGKADYAKFESELRAALEQSPRPS